jgi:hypothetical protein
VVLEATTSGSFYLIERHLRLQRTNADLARHQTHRCAHVSNERKKKSPAKVNFSMAKATIMVLADLTSKVRHRNVLLAGRRWHLHNFTRFLKKTTNKQQYDVRSWRAQRYRAASSRRRR